MVLKEATITTTTKFVSSKTRTVKRPRPPRAKPCLPHPGSPEYERMKRALAAWRQWVSRVCSAGTTPTATPKAGPRFGDHPAAGGPHGPGLSRHNLRNLKTLSSLCFSSNNVVEKTNYQDNNQVCELEDSGCEKPTANEGKTLPRVTRGQPSLNTYHCGQDTATTWGIYFEQKGQFAYVGVNHAPRSEMQKRSEHLSDFSFKTLFLNNLFFCKLAYQCNHENN